MQRPAQTTRSANSFLLLFAIAVAALAALPVVSVGLNLLVGGSSDLGDIHRPIHFGFQGGAGYWFDPTKTLGAEVNGIYVRKGYERVEFDTFVSAPLTVTTAARAGRPRASTVVSHVCAVRPAPGRKVTTGGASP